MRKIQRVIIVYLLVFLLHVPWNNVVTGQNLFPGNEWAKAQPGALGMETSLLAKARDYALLGGGAGYITRHGKLAMSWGDPDRCFELKSTTKSIGVTALGLAIADGKIKLGERAVGYHPSLAVPPGANTLTGWINRITILNLATHTAGFEKPGGYTDLFFEPGTMWSYSNSGANWLAECITLVYRRDIESLMFERVFLPLGITREDLTWRKNKHRPNEIDGIVRREFGAGIIANVDALCRIGYLYLRNGRWQDRQIIPQNFVAMASRPVDSVVGLPEVNRQIYGNASDHYGLMWWNNADRTLVNVPADAYWAWGIQDSIILVIPSLDIVVARSGAGWQDGWAPNFKVLRPFFEPIVASVRDRPPGDAADESGGGCFVKVVQ